MLLAWVTALSALDAAVARHAVFGFHDTLAFIVVVMLPALYLNKLGEAPARVRQRTAVLLADSLEPTELRPRG